MLCTDCKYCYTQDYGYSNWTVEGTDADCLHGLNPAFPVDKFYDVEPALKFAETCPKFTEDVDGVGIELDVDMEDGDIENYTSDPELIKLWKEGVR